MAPVNPDLVKERKSATFDIEKLTHLLDGGKDLTEKRRKLEKIGLAEDAFTNVPVYNFQSREEIYDSLVKKSVHYMRVCNKLGLDQNDQSLLRSRVAFPNEIPPIGLQYVMFIPTLLNQGSEEQKKKWLPQAERFNIVGTYAQTELGHGTHIRKLETTATYDPAREEFVINSPTVTSTKWWPGGLGKTSNHAVLMAQLYTQGKCHGIQPFIVQIRDLETHQPLKGVIVGDIGPKFGYDSVDNGFLRFDHVRIPRENLMMKNVQVQKDGTFLSTAKNKKLAYGTMVYVRAGMVKGIGAMGLGEACTIAIRYSCVRRQSELKPGGGEPQILDFQTQQFKLFPMLATSFAYMFTGNEMGRMYLQINKDIQQGNVDLLPELHALSSCLKAASTYAGMLGLEQCRLACGGHGYSHASGIPKIYGVMVADVTVEGEYTVLMLQTARYLMKAYDQMKGGNLLSGQVSYLSQPNNATSQLRADMDLHSLLEAFRYKAARLVTRAGTRLEKLRAAQEYHDAWNHTTVNLVAAAEAHAQVFVVETFVKTVESVSDKPLHDVLRQLCQLYACYLITKDATEFVSSGYFSESQLDMVNEAMLDLLVKIRPNAVALVDSYEFSDHLLGSVLGRYDGNVYENLLKWAKSSPLNKTEVHPSYNKYVKPFRLEMQSSSKL